MEFVAFSRSAKSKKSEQWVLAKTPLISGGKESSSRVFLSIFVDELGKRVSGPKLKLVDSQRALELLCSDLIRSLTFASLKIKH